MGTAAGTTIEKTSQLVADTTREALMGNDINA